jgi:PHD/YefM family antitoxin component YafN of YafNO toxin-antitoxin module
MKTIELSEASRPLSDYAEELDEEIIVLTSKKRPVAALVSLKDVDRESLALSTSSEFMAIIEAARGEFRSGKKLSLEEMKREVLE